MYDLKRKPASVASYNSRSGGNLDLKAREEACSALIWQKSYTGLIIRHGRVVAVSTTRIVTVGFLQAFALALYCGAIATALVNAQSWIPPFPNPSVSFFAFLMLFVFSALVSGSAVLGYPAYLGLTGRLGQAFAVLASTVAWLALFLGVITLWLLSRGPAF